MDNQSFVEKIKNNNFWKSFIKLSLRGDGKNDFQKLQIKKNFNKANNKELIKNIKQGKIFIYPTDTIYGLGCDATNIKAVLKIKSIKKRDKNKPLSIIAPSINWINEHCIIDINLNKYLPGPYTIILKKKNPNFLKHVSNTDSLGVRIPDNELTKQIQKSNIPFITTSLNLSGQPNIKSIDEIPKEIKDKVDIIIDGGKLSGSPSTLIINGKEVRRVK